MASGIDDPRLIPPKPPEPLLRPQTELDRVRKAVERLIDGDDGFMPTIQKEAAKLPARALLYVGDCIRAAIDVAVNPMMSLQLSDDGRMTEVRLHPPPVCTGTGQVANWSNLLEAGPCPICGQPVKTVEAESAGYFIECHQWRDPRMR